MYSYYMFSTFVENHVIYLKANAITKKKLNITL